MAGRNDVGRGLWFDSCTRFVQRIPGAVMGKAFRDGLVNRSTEFMRMMVYGVGRRPLLLWFENRPEGFRVFA